MKPTFRSWRKPSFILPLLLIAHWQGSFAATPLDAGGQLKQIPPAPALRKDAPKIDILPSPAPAPLDPQGERIMVKSLKIAGAEFYTQDELLRVAGFKPGSQMTLLDLRDMATKIADHYHKNGYFVAQVYLPPQDIVDGSVTIAVMVGKYDNFTLRNETNLSDNLAKGILEGLNKADPIKSAPLENRLLLLSDIPGIFVKSSLVPGASVGTSDLIVDILPGERMTGSLDADNAGNRLTGLYRLGSMTNINNPSGLGDVVSLRTLTSGEGLKYARASYQIQMGKATAGIAYSGVKYALGKELDSLDATGTARIASIFGRYPLARSRQSSLYAQLAYDAKTFQDKVASELTVSGKRARVLMASLSGDHRDDFAGGGQTAFSVTLTSGNVDIKTFVMETFDTETARSDGQFRKIGANFSRLQSVTDSLSLSAAFNGQFASRNLDASEKMELGGMYGVRAYPEGEAYGDQGYVANLEVRYLLPKFYPYLPGQMQLIGFVDVGSVMINKRPWASGQNGRTLGGAGFGVTWAEANDYSLKAYFAHGLGNEAVASDPKSASSRFWMQALKFF
ncbi:MAG: ShlB/FhaC/HecB family hemolysin secretion/activation protein [Alphaproteobacteria bacterium]|nr:ShlB/FhaC/HecB family hemolysin secretion/activation protein [Alphaproteobacteria bacterium]